MLSRKEDSLKQGDSLFKPPKRNSLFVCTSQCKFAKLKFMYSTLPWWVVPSVGLQGPAGCGP